MNKLEEKVLELLKELEEAEDGFLCYMIVSELNDIIKSEGLEIKELLSINDY